MVHLLRARLAVVWRQCASILAMIALLSARPYPYLDMAYKLVRYGTRNVLKLSAGKATWTGRKQVYRVSDAAGRFQEDLVALEDEPPPSSTRVDVLLRSVMRDGAPIEPRRELGPIREHCARQVAALPDGVRRLHDAEPYPVRFSARLVSVPRRLEQEMHATEGAGSTPCIQT